MVFSGFLPGSWSNPTKDNLNFQQYFGFRFDIAGQTHYGYAEFKAVVPNPGSFYCHFPDPKCLLLQVTISRWAYNTDANQGLLVEPFNDSTAVPGPIGLAGLAAGAAWTRKLRRRIKAAA